MTVQSLQDTLGLKLLAGESGMNEAIEDCYVGDLLSWVMGRAQEGSVWITVMGNVNAIAVAKLAEIRCILLCENAHLDDEAMAEANRNGVPVLAGERNAYRYAVEVHKLLEGGK